MTEAEWLSDRPVEEMLCHIEEIASERRLRLFALACCHRVEHALVDDRSRAALAGLEQYVTGQVDRNELAALYALAKEATDAVEAPFRIGVYIEDPNAHFYAAAAVQCATDPEQPQPHNYPSWVDAVVFHARWAIRRLTGERTGSSEEAKAADTGEAIIQANLLRDIFGNPFRPVAFDPAWLTSDVLALARGIYDERAFGRMPILADALQDAGCGNEDVLSHCRGAGPHVRGCWVVDRVLEKL